MRVSTTKLMISTLSLALLAGCGKEQPPRSVTEFVDNPIMLEGTIVRCSQDRAATRYDAECVNARQAVRQLEARDGAAKRAALEAQSESKRQALRNTQQAAAQARRRAAEAARLRKEAEYLAQFGVAPPAEGESAIGDEPIGNSPLAVIPEGTQQQAESSGNGAAVPATDGGNAPAVSADPEDTPRDLDSIRDELQRRNDEQDGT